MNDRSRSEGDPHSSGRTPHIRRIHVPLTFTRSPVANAALVIGVMVVIVILVYQFMFRGRGVSADVIDFSQSIERIQELSTVRSQIRFAVVVREEGGNLIVNRLADQARSIGMDDLSSALFQEPTMIVELHGVATYGVNLKELTGGMRQNDTAVFLPHPAATLLDAKLVARDTRVVARMKGLFRSPNDELLLAADREGERFVEEYARQDTALLSLASAQTRELLGLLVERGGKRAIFE